jgi:hypothetical protein
MVRTAERFVAGEWDDAITKVEASVELVHETGQAFGLILDRSVCRSSACIATISTGRSGLVASGGQLPARKARE